MVGRSSEERFSSRYNGLWRFGIFGLLMVLIYACTHYGDFERQLFAKRVSTLKGEQLIELAACTYCHGMNLEGQITEEFAAPNLTRLQRYTDEELLSYMRGNTLLGDEDRSTAMHRGYEWMSDSDIFPIIAYLRKLAPQGELVETDGGGLFGPSYDGEVKGLVPDVVGASLESKGKYLVDHVARCSFCHSSGDSSDEYLRGGEIEWLGDVKAPSLLTPEVLNAQGMLHRRQVSLLVSYLQKPRHKNCPSYVNTSHEQLVAISEFLVKLWHD